MRLRFNNTAGALGSPALTAGATTITFAVAPGFATITAPDYIPLVLDPPQGPSPNPSFEIVYLTGYTSGATTGVMSRGQEGTTATSHNVGATWALAPTALDLAGQAPIGSIVPYSGSGDPRETNWVIADGRLIDKTVYADFFARTGHVYNGGVDPGANKVRIPDKRGFKSVGAINMGSAAGAGANDTSHIQAGQGTSAGLTAYALASSEMPVHSHGGATVAASAAISEGSGHFHTITDPSHAHTVPNLSAGSTALQLHTSGGSWTAPGTSAGITTDSSFTGINNTDRDTTGITDTGHAHTINNNGGGAAHTNIDPYQADSYIVRIA